ncbi:MAG: hypothetical protein H0W45_01525 [Acidobacteria bacterium]|jgi:hypothetical protein|nr:hypothetical protein [Acidobacteriota bacterium]
MPIKGVKYINKNNRLVMSQLTTIEEQENRSFDVEFWQRLNAEQRMQAVWDLVVFDYELKGKNLDELRLQRTVENLRSREG